MDWLKGLKVGDFIISPGVNMKICIIAGKTPKYWECDSLKFRKSDGRICGKNDIYILEPTSENVKKARDMNQRRVMPKYQIENFANRATMEQLDAIIAIFERAGK